jgi:hypothetical protein
MATTVAPASKSDAAVERGIATAAARVRLNDLLTGGAALAVLLLGYVAVMMVFDKWLVLPAWVRQLGFAGLLAGAAGVGYLFVVRPLRRRVNPRYIARQVEQTLPDAKNVLINWVDLQDRELPGSVKSAVASKAAAGFAGADVDAATNPRSLVWLGALAGALVAVLAVLFLVFKWTQFSSLVSRAVNPFATTVIASRTQIELLDPTEGNATVTDGEQLNIAVRIDGRVPDLAGPEKPRLLVRHTPDAEPDEFPLVRGESSREFALMVPRSVIQNGFWYRVAAGDAETPEYRVTVRTRPMLTAFHAEYEYPAYLKWPADTSVEAKIKAYRGTAVTFTVKTNREVASGELAVVTPAGVDTLRGDVVDDKRESLRFKLKLDQSGAFTVRFKPTGSEPTVTSAEYPIEVQIDQPPAVTIVAPKDEETALPATGMLAVDATVSDDFGITAAALRFKLVGRDGVTIPAKKYRDGKPFVRAKDGTFETTLPDYKDSVKLDALTDDRGQPLGLKPGDVLEYWVEATDNCTEPKANVGESAHKKVKIAPPPPQPDPQQPQKDQQRKADEQKAQKQQDQRQQNDARPPEQGRNPDPEKQPQGDPQNQPQDPMKGDDKQQPQDPMKGDGKGDQTGQPDQKDQKQPGDKTGGKGETQPDSKQGNDPGQQDTKPMPPGGTDQKQPDQKKQDQKADPNQKADPMGGGSGQNDPNQKADSSTKQDPNQKSTDQSQGGGSENKPSDQELQKKADDLQRKLDQQKSEPGDAKGDGNTTPKEQQTKPDAAAKPLEGGNKGSNPPASEQKPEPKGDGAGQPAGDPKPSESKDGGTMTQPERSEEKAPPKDGAKGTDQPMTDKPKGGPEDKQGASESKESKPEQKPDPMGGKQGDDKKDGQAGAAKAADPKAGETGEKPGEPTSGSKPKADPERANAKPHEKPSKEQGGEKGTEQKPAEQDRAGDAKGDKPSEPGSKKGAQPEKADGSKPNEQKGATEDAGTEKGAPKPDTADPMGKKEETGEGKGEGTKPEAKADQTASKPATPDKKPSGSQPETTDQKQPGGSGTDQKPTRQEIDDAVRELDSENPGSRAKAQEKLDKAMGKQNRETVERLNRDAKSADPQKREQAKKDIDELSKKASQQQPKELTEQEKKDLADAAKNLNSKNDAERQAAEKKLDDALGKKQREELQQDLKDLTGNDPEKAKKAQEKLEQMAKDAQNQNSGREPGDRPGGGNYDKDGKPIAADLENQLKTRERQLREFKDIRGKKEFLRENNLTEEEFEKFVKSYEEMVDRTRADVDRQKLGGADPTVPVKPGIRNDAGGARVVGRGADGGAVQGAGGVSVAPPGFSEAQKRFAQEAAKQRGGQK